MKFTFEIITKVKLIIWDLDDTFWSGTLSDNDNSVTPIFENIDLVKRLADRGIISSICSKNDEEQAKKKLEELSVSDYFVFNSINWDPKGYRIKNTLSTMALRPQNVLFIDDNNSNLAEVEYVLPDIMVSTPDILPQLYNIADTLGKDDKEHTRLEQYKLLEIKNNDAAKFESNQAFLRQSNIRIQYAAINDVVIPRITELIQRSNQLNFTKKRITEAELRDLTKDEDYDLGYVSVADNYGMYGIVGFYAIKKSTHQLEHFLFSCRTMGMGIEQHVYATLNYPELIVVEPVSGKVSKMEGIPDYITRVQILDNKTEHSTHPPKSSFSVLLKGPCDLEVMASYIVGGEINLEKEFNFIDSNGNQADYCNHLINILNQDKTIITEWCKKYSFLSPDGFSTKMFTGKYDVICLSPLMDSTLSVYEDINNNRLAYGLYTKPLTDHEYHHLYLSKQVMTARSNFSIDELNTFAEDFKKIDYKPEHIAENLKTVVERIVRQTPTTRIAILLLAELPYKSNDPNYNDFYKDKHIIHKNINNQIKKIFSNSEAVYLLDVNKYINSQADYFDNINHYSKYVYYEMAQDFSQYLAKISNKEIKLASKIKMGYQNIRRNIYKKLFIDKGKHT